VCNVFVVILFFFVFSIQLLHAPSDRWHESKHFRRREDKLQTVAVMINGDGRTSYTAQAYVRADSGINSFAQLKGKRACHTGFLKSAGMYVLHWTLNLPASYWALLSFPRHAHQPSVVPHRFMPIGFGVRNGFIEEKATLAETVESFFSAGSCAAPTLCSTCKSNQVNGQCAKDPYSDYSGALMCLRCAAFRVQQALRASLFISE
jgi:hypothetical protein